MKTRISNGWLVGIAAWVIALPWAGAVAQAPLPQPQTYNGGRGEVTYLNGGAGEEEQRAIKAAMKDYPLALVFARTGGEYVSSVAITVKDGKGVTVFEAPSVGPHLLLKLPAGHYSVVADFHGDTKVRPVLVGTKAAAPIGFSWP